MDHQRDKFRWIDCNDKDGQTLSYLRFGERPEETILVACNFSDQLGTVIGAVRILANGV